MKKDALPIANPCPKRWNDMSGGDSCRLCSGCDKNVHHLSHMTETEAERLLETESEPCVIYHYDRRGDVKFRKPSLFHRVAMFITVIVPFSPLMTACGGIPNRPVNNVQDPECGECSQNNVENNVFNNATFDAGTDASADATPDGAISDVGVMRDGGGD